MTFIMIDAIANYGARLAEKNNFTEIAESMKKHIDLHEDIKKEMRKLNPNIFNKQQKSRSYSDHER